MLNEKYRIKLLDIHLTVRPPILITTAWRMSTGVHRGEWFLVYPAPMNKVFQQSLECQGLDIEKTLDELDRQGVEKAFNIEYARCRDGGIESSFRPPKGTDVAMKDIAQHWLQGLATEELREVAKDTNCPGLKYDLTTLMKVPPVK